MTGPKIEGVIFRGYLKNDTLHSWQVVARVHTQVNIRHHLRILLHTALLLMYPYVCHYDGLMSCHAMT